MTTHIKPDITDLEQDFVNKILEILTYKQGQLFREQKMPEKEQQASDILNGLMSYIERRNTDV